MQYSATPAPQGLYDPQFERDACGVAAVADIKGRRSHSIVNNGVTALINLDHRGAAGADPAVGDGAGILIQVPDELLPGGRRLRRCRSAPTRGTARRTPSGWRSCRPTERAARRGQGDRRPDRRGGGPELLGWRPVPTDPVGSGVGQMALDVMPAFEQLFLAAPGRRRTAHCRSASTWTGSSTRPASGSSTTPRSLTGERARRLLRVAVQPDHRLQGHADHRAAAGVLRRHHRRADDERDRDRALPVLHQHLPGLAAGPPVPLHRAQRRDQHRPRQPQPDARPRGDAGLQADPRRPGQGVPDLHPGRARTRRRSTRCSSCCTWAAAPCRTRC